LYVAVNIGGFALPGGIVANNQKQMTRLANNFREAQKRRAQKKATTSGTAMQGVRDLAQLRKESGGSDLEHVTYANLRSSVNLPDFRQ
jgi:hypothetical protein